MKLLLVALFSSFMQQTFVSIGKVLPAVLAPMIIAEQGFDPSLVGVYFGLTSVFALIAQMGCGSFIMRHGPLRMSQVALLMLSFGMLCMTGRWKIAFFLSAMIGGGGAAISTPTSSQLLGKMSPPKLAPLMFSIRQTGVPMGLLLGGAFGPTVAQALGWRGAVWVSAGACVAFVFLLQPLRAIFDVDRQAGRTFKLSDFPETIRTVLRGKALRTLSSASFAFNGMQQVMTSYFVIYLTSLGYPLVSAGYIFSSAVAIAIPGRILWGWLGSFYVSPRIVLAGLALGIAASAIAVGCFTSGWSLAAIGIAAGVMSASAMSWHGILLSETARLAPSNAVGPVSAGVLSCGQCGALIGPLVYAALLSVTGSYGIGFVVCAIPSLLVGIGLLRQKPA